MSKSAQENAVVVSAPADAEAMLLAPGVMETIVRIAVNDVDGVVGVCSPQASRPRKLFSSKSAAPGVDVAMDDNGKASIAVHLTVNYGHVLPDLAAQVRQAIAEALASQVGVGVNNIDVYIDNIAFN